MSQMTPCPDPEVLAAFAEGKLERKELPRIFAHLETCAACRSGVAAASSSVAPARSSSFRIVFPLSIAAVIVIAIGLVPWLLAKRSPLDRLNKLAPRSARVVETRLSGDMPWAAYRGPMRSSNGAATDPDRLKLGGEVGEIVDRANRERTASWQHAAGIGLVLIEEPADAVARLRTAAELEPKNARVWSDLAAAQYAAALRLDRPSLYPEALASADHALRVDPRLPEALFNRALTLERLGLPVQAREAWTRYLAVDGTSPWAVEAREHLAKLPMSTSEERFQKESLEHGDVRAIVHEYRQQTRTTAEVVTLGKWAAAYQQGDAPESARLLAVARSIGDALQSASGESLLHDAVASIEQSADTSRLAEAHASYLRGRVAYSKRQPAAAEPDLRRAASLFGADPMTLVARYYAACIRYDRNDVAGASAELTALLKELEKRPQYIALAAQVRWQLALCAMVDDDWQTATPLLQASRDGFARLGERSNGGFLDALLANALGAAGRSDDGWAARIRSFEALSAEGKSDRMPASLSEAATMEIRAGRPEVARSILEIEESMNRAAGYDVLLAYSLVRATVLNLYLDDPMTAVQKAKDAEQTARGIADPALRTRALADADLAIGAATSDRAALTRAIDGYQAIERPWFLPEARLFRARVEMRGGNVDAAMQDLDAGIAEMERHRVHFAGNVSGRGVFDAGTEIFRLAMRLALDRGDVAGAFRYAEQSRAYVATRDEAPSAITAMTLQTRLAGSHAAVLELVALPEELLAFAVTESSVRVARSAVTSSQLASEEDAGRLYEWLIRPSEASIAAARQLIVVPDPLLENVSFAGLWDERGKRHLIERMAVAVAPNASSLRAEADARDPQSIALVALPTGEQGESVALPRASAELKEIAGLYRHAVSLDGHAATFAALQQEAREAGVIHIAGHTERRGPAGDSTLAFLDPQGKGLDYVSWRNLAAMSLRSRPVVLLAACETLHRPRSPQTFALSLGGGFLAAGAPEVIGTLVPLADRDAQELFEDVHRQLRSGFPPAEALRRTQMRALADRSGRRLPWQALALLTNRIPR
ncbi:MAG: CHAT domain-containing protein [Acidobacteria bacterium]|nr:CHAT domain-containing protein [Acidobacteriota bacterium]